MVDADCTLVYVRERMMRDGSVSRVSYKYLTGEGWTDCRLTAPGGLD